MIYCINVTNEHNLSKSNSLSANATLQLNRKLNNEGRNITFRGSFGYGDDDSDQYAQSETRYYQIKNYLGGISIEHRNWGFTLRCLLKIIIIQYNPFIANL